jgi:DNA primase
MNRNDVVEWLTAMGASVPVSQGRGGWIVSNCPFGEWRHDNGKSGPDAFGVRLESGVPFCNCFSCGWHGDAADATIELRHLEKQSPSGIDRDFGIAQKLIEKADKEFDLDLDGPGIEEALAKKAEMLPFDEDWLASFGPVLASKKARAYLKTRQAPDEVLEALDVRWDGSQDRICFPVRDFKGRLMGLHGRSIHEGVEPRYRMYQFQKRTNPLIWLGESWIDTDKPILVIEGPFDLASCARVYRNVCSPLFANPSYEKLRRMADCLDIVTLLDRGKAGDQGRQRIEKSLPGSNVINLVPPEGIKDPGVADTDQLSDILGPYLELDETIY